MNIDGDFHYKEISVSNYNYDLENLIEDNSELIIIIKVDESIFTIYDK